MIYSEKPGFVSRTLRFHSIRSVAFALGLVLVAIYPEHGSFAESVVVKDTFSTNDFTRKVGDPLNGTAPEIQPPGGKATWQVAGPAVYSADGAIVPSAPAALVEARIAIPVPDDIVTVSARVNPATSDWIAVGFQASDSNDPKASYWFAKDGSGALVWLLLRPGGQWTLVSQGASHFLVGGGPSGYPSVFFQEGSAYSIGLNYDPQTRRARPFIKDGETEIALHKADGGWVDTRLPARATVAAAGFRINATAGTLAGKPSVDDFVVGKAGEDAVPRFTQLPPEIRSQILPGTPRASVEIKDSPFGIQTTIMQEGGSPAFIEQMAELVSKGGFKWVVDYIEHSGTDGMIPAQVEQKYAQLPQRYLTWARQLRAIDVNLLVRLDPFRWQPGSDHAKRDYSPGSPDVLRASAFVRQVVRQLKPWTRHWQIWNEPNIGNENPYVTPEDFVKQHATLAAVIRAEQPDAVIYGPGTAMLQCLTDKPYPWLDRAFRAGLLDHLDVFTYHPYRQPIIRKNIPENASEFYPWKVWRSYENQIADLRSKIAARTGPGHTVTIGTTEDGEPDFINGAGEQQLTWIIQGKYELRRALLDFHLGVYPRTLFCLYRHIPDAFYNEQGSYNIVVPVVVDHREGKPLKVEFHKKPAYNAAQNLNAVLDSSYSRDDTIPVKITPAADSGSGKPAGEVKIQTYRKDHGAFEELLVFYWSAEPGNDIHPRYPASLRIDEPGWQAPLLIDLMAMPVPRPARAPVEIIDSKFVDRRDPEALVARKVETGVTVGQIEIRDYPILIKWIRIK